MKGFEYIPEIKALELTDALDNVIIISSVSFILFEDTAPLMSLFKLFSTFSITYLLRSLTVFLTSLPDPRMGCQRIESNFFTTIVFHRCGDCIFSGHAVVGTLFSLYWAHVRPRARNRIFKFMRFMVWSTTIAEFWAIIANRSHYTVDVAVAIYTSVGVFYSFSFLLEKHREILPNFINI